MAGQRLAATDRRAGRLAWSGFAAAVVLFAATAGFTAAGWGRCLPAWQSASAEGARACQILLANHDIGGAAEGLSFGLAGLLFAALGALLAARRSDNIVGWIFLAAGIVFVANAAATVYSIHGAESPGLPGALFAAVIAEVLGGPIVFAPFALFFLLFPDGSVLSRRWRPVVGAVIVSIVVQTLDLALHRQPLRLSPLHVNPIGLPFLNDSVRPLLQTPAFVLLLAALVASVVSLVLRFRRSRGVEREQMKWFTTSSAFVGVTFALAPLFWATPQLEVIWGPLFMVAIASVPVAATIAILRYRLYDIDVLINRALVYGALTALLATIYLGLVVVIQTVLTGWGGSSDVAVAASTLAVAAVFRPLRARLQGFIDHSFYRRKYNALRTVEAFSAQLRMQTDVVALRGELLSTVHTTVQPARAMVWLRGDS